MEIKLGGGEDSLTGKLPFSGREKRSLGEYRRFPAIRRRGKHSQFEQESEGKGRGKMKLSSAATASLRRCSEYDEQAHLASSAVMVPRVGVEPTLLSELDFESSASANSAIRALQDWET